MTLPATLFGTTVRLLRTAVARRALQLVLLVGGLFLLGFLCGEQAHAAEGALVAPVAPVTSVTSVASVVTATPVAVVQSVTGHTDTGREINGDTIVPVQPVTELVLTPVRTVLDTASQVLDATQVKVSPPSAPPGMPLPVLSRAPEPSTSPLSDAPVTSEPPQGPGATAAPASAPADSTRADGTRANDARAEGRTAARAESGTAVELAPAPATPYGPGRVQAPQRPTHARTFAGRVHSAAESVGVPGHPAPGGAPDGVLGKQAADGGVPRHGDTYAVALSGRAPVRLVSGATARTDASRTRERHRDIPVFPG
ncbi:hypothetical protein OIB37_22435 [Streptomyces sp. NBC_00820]|uniref:hypothetical protein n=1 Tax=Streptomyces sp. NBC_00820 TaxID=2975842 RepID=UPI002ED3D69C|nr:hypothetical protein OIB37_22435 [Streptomyces sp. NBC_00820]